MIGGVFEIQAVPPFRANAPLPGAFASGRAALYQLLRHIGAPRKVWLPGWICSSVTEAVKKAGCTPKSYSLTPALQADMESIAAKEGDIVLVVNYFGMVDCSGQVSALTEAFPGITVIEDDVQAYYAFEAGSQADYSFTSLRKTFAVPDGGLVKPVLPPAQVENRFAAKAIDGAVLKALRCEGMEDSVYLKLLEEAERQIDSDYDASMSRAGRALWEKVEVEEVARKRRENALRLAKGLKQLGVEPLLVPVGPQVPLFLPVLLPGRDEVRKHLFAHEVFCPVHWPGADWEGRELSLIVDQRYGPEDMDMMLTLLDDKL